MIELTIDNSECTIEGLTPTEFKELSSILSYNIDSGYTSKQYYKPRKVSLLSKRGVFPTGLLYLVNKYCSTKSANVCDKRIRPVMKNLFKLDLGYVPYNEQKQAALASKKFHRGIIVAPTGVGKSAISALIIQELQVSTLLIVPSLELKRQLTEFLIKCYGKDKVGLDKDICVQNIDSVKCKRRYDCVIIDEFHHSGAKSYRKLNKSVLNGTYYRFGLTATPFRSQENERLLLESVLSQVIYRIEYQDAVKKGYIVPLEAYYYELPKINIKGMTWSSVYSEGVVNNEGRNSLIINLLKSLKASQKSTLCLVKEIKHGQTLSEGASIHFANGINDDTADLIRFFSAGKLGALIGTTGVLGEGVDTKPAEFIIIAGLGKSKNQFIQQAGRGFRNYTGKETCKVIIFKDNSHKWFRDHYKAQCKVLLDEYGIVPIKLDI